MLSRLRHWLTFLLFVLVPFNALIVTVGTRIVAGPGHAPLSMIAVWKEVLIAIILLIGIIELFIIERRTIGAIIGGGSRWTFSIDSPTLLIVLLLSLSLLLLPRTSDYTSFAYGFKYLFLPLIVFLLFRRLKWDAGFIERPMMLMLMFLGLALSVYGIITHFLPQSFFSFLGYSDAHSLYAPGSPLSAFQYIAGTGVRRIQSTFSGPNQFGIWLLIPWAMALVSTLRQRMRFRLSLGGLLILDAYIILIAYAILLSFSRSAALAAFFMTILACLLLLEHRHRVFMPYILMSIAVIGVVLISAFFPQMIIRTLSTREHIVRVREGVVSMLHEPLGRGLGAAGPASNRVSDPCVYFEAGADLSWAADRNDLCIFVDGKQVKPYIQSRQCRCPVLPENWFVQVGIELGILGFVLFTTLVIVILRMLLLRSQLSVFLFFLGTALAALFLHAYEDSAVAYTVWGLTGIVLSSHMVEVEPLEEEDDEENPMQLGLL